MDFPGRVCKAARRYNQQGTINLRLLCYNTSEELSPAAVLHAQVEIILGLEGVIKCHNERVVTGGENLLLCQCPFDLVPLDHFLLTQN